MSAKPTSPIVCYCSSTISIEMGTTENKTTEKIIIEAARRVFMFSPFTLHPMVKLVTDVPDPLTREYLASWKPCILAQIKALLATD